MRRSTNKFSFQRTDESFLLRLLELRKEPGMITRACLPLNRLPLNPALNYSTVIVICSEATGRLCGTCA